MKTVEIMQRAGLVPARFSVKAVSTLSGSDGGEPNAYGNAGGNPVATASGTDLSRRVW